MKKIILFLSLCCASLAVPACGDTPGADSVVTPTESAIQFSTSTWPPYYYRSSVGLFNGSTVVVEQNAPTTVADTVGGCAKYLVVSGARIQCTACLAWAGGSPNFPGGNRPGVPRNYGGGITHGVSLPSSASRCTIDGVGGNIPAGALEWWETTYTPAVGDTANPAAYLIYRLSGYLAYTSAVLRTAN